MFTLVWRNVSDLIERVYVPDNYAASRIHHNFYLYGGTWCESKKATKENEKAAHSLRAEKHTPTEQLVE